MIVPPTLRAVFITPASGAMSCATGSSADSRRAPFGGSKGIAGGPCGDASVIDNITRTSAMPSA